VSLNAHLTATTAQHGRLRFHPDCPRCRAERLAGSLGDDALVSRRAQAALAAGVLAFSAAAPSAVAQVGEVDQDQEGMAAPGGDEPGLEPDFDPGGDDTFDVDTAPVPGGPEAGGEEDDGQGAPVETEPTIDLEAPLVLEDAPEPLTGAPEPTPAPAPPPPSPPVEPSAPPPAAVALKEPGAAEAARPKIRHLRLKLDQGRMSERAKPSAPAPPAVQAQHTIAPAAAPEAAPVTQPVSAPQAPVKGDSYTVRPGDSLWSIARRLLGPDASAGQIAGEVNRLWELNRERIATGDPDLLRVGTELEL
jgi:hypothetical protein